MEQESLAKHIGITKGRLSQIESGECEELTISRMEKIALYLGVNFFMLLTDNIQNIRLNNFANHNSYNETPFTISVELITDLADELVKRMFNS